MKTKYILYVTVLFLLAACGTPENNQEEVPASGPGQVFEKGMSLTYTDRGHKVWEIRAETLSQQDDDTGIVKAADVKISFYSTHGDIDHIITSDRGTISLKSNDVILEGNVILESIPDNTVIYTERAHYKAGEDQVVSRDPVEIVRGTSVVRGEGMTVDLKTNEITMIKPHGKK
jgi:LPS export ABC transporter protein LptC